MLLCNHLSISTFKFHIKILFKNSRSNAQVSPSYLIRQGHIHVKGKISHNYTKEIQFNSIT